MSGLLDIEDQMHEAVEYCLANFIADGYTAEVARLTSAIDDARDVWFENLMQENA